jgi:hypothetical protein
MRTVKERTDGVDLIGIEILQWGCLPLLLLVIFPLAKVLLVVEVQWAANSGCFARVSLLSSAEESAVVGVAAGTIDRSDSAGAINRRDSAGAIVGVAGIAVGAIAAQS